MKTIAIILCLALAGLLLSGCASTPGITAEQFANADYGPPPTNYEAELRALISSELKDPYSAVYRFRRPYAGYTTGAKILGAKLDKFGWIAQVVVNAKNSFGAYVGERTYSYFYKDGVWRDISYMSDFGN